MISAIVVDIEGTTSPTASVRMLYSYVHDRLNQWITTDAADVVIKATRNILGQPNATPQNIANTLRLWLVNDVKAEPLKTAQGLICAQGFLSGELRGVFYEDVRPALIRWRADGIELFVYSSGSARNQQDWFTYTDGGEMASLVSGWFDLSTAGPKHYHSSYDSIAKTIRHPSKQILLLSDHPAELDSATAAGWTVLGVSRDAEPSTLRPPHRWIASFVDINDSLSGYERLGRRTS